ncbi:MAG: hypothetical protein H0T83_05310 [Chthoniobacterales bacterium]|nr:hypothetical protein [Chthoniobacterales bacterium]
MELDPRNFFTLQQISLSYQGLKRFPEVVAAQDRALSIKPDDMETKVARAQAKFDWKADTQPMHQLRAQIEEK